MLNYHIFKFYFGFLTLSVGNHLWVELRGGFFDELIHHIFKYFGVFSVFFRDGNFGFVFVLLLFTISLLALFLCAHFQLYYTLLKSFKYLI
jgi:hypothetical protein